MKDIIDENGGIDWLIPELERSARFAVNNKRYWDNLILYLPTLYEGVVDVEKDALDYKESVEATRSYMERLHTKYNCPISPIILKVLQVKLDYIADTVPIKRKVV